MAVKPEQFKMFFELCRTFGNDMLSFMHSMDLGTGADYFRQDLEQVSVMTMHAAKGLEFPCVFIIGCEDGLLPFTLLPEYACDVEEEKRLLYVAMTRAKRHLILSHVHRRFMYGKSMRLKRSRFLDAIEEEVVEVSQVEYIRKESRSDNQLELF
jgi:superfamily I DNA/RNA helicase